MLTIAVGFGYETLDKFLFCTFSSIFQFFLQLACVFLIREKTVLQRLSLKVKMALILQYAVLQGRQ